MTGKGLYGKGALERLGIEQQAKILLLGTFYFDYPGLDAYKSEQKIDVLSEKRQVEVLDLVARLAAFRPTKVAVERRLERDEELQEEYQAYRKGSFDLPRSEVYQLGFRIADCLDHERLYPVDEWGHLYEPWEQVMGYAADFLGMDKDDLSAEELQEAVYRVLSGGRMPRVMELLREEDSLLTGETLREHLLRINSPKAIRLSHGLYLSWLDAEPGDYVMVDHVSGWWYNRNLRIFANIKRICESPGDRLLVIFGSGHLPLIRHSVECSWDFELVEAADYLG